MFLGFFGEIHVIADIGLLSVYGLLSVQKQFLIHFHLLFQSGISAYRLAGLFLSLCLYIRYIFFLFCDRKNILADICSRFTTGNGFIMSFKASSSTLNISLFFAIVLIPEI